MNGNWTKSWRPGLWNMKMPPVDDVLTVNLVVNLITEQSYPWPNCDSHWKWQVKLFGEERNKKYLLNDIIAGPTSAGGTSAFLDEINEKWKASGDISICVLHKASNLYLFATIMIAERWFLDVINLKTWILHYVLSFTSQYSKQL